MDFTGGSFYWGQGQAFQSNCDQKVGAIIIKGGNLLAVGYNRVEAHPKAYYQCSIHAEWDAIKNCANPSGAKLLVYRFTRLDGTLAPSKPCILCKEQIKRANISRTYYVDAEFKVCAANLKVGSSLQTIDPKYIIAGTVGNKYGY